MDQQQQTHNAYAAELLALAQGKGWQVPVFNLSLYKDSVTRYCIVIPLINEGQRIHSLLRRIHSLQLDQVADIVLVDGGSSDGSLTPEALHGHRLCALLTKTGPGGLSAQLRCGYAFALLRGYAGIVTIDGNNKDDPASMRRFFECLDSGFEMVQASRFIEGGVAENTPLLRWVAIRALHAPVLSLASGFHWTDTTQGYRAYSATMLLDSKVGIFCDIFLDYELLAYLSYRAPKLGYKCLEVPTRRSYPADGAVPTKIGGWRGNARLLSTLYRACFGKFNP
jgi:glycosyltransferase involved in cell wall biosynthesis